MKTGTTVFLIAMLLAATTARADERANEVVDATSLRGRVMTGYQGWFRCPGDAAGAGWMHWSRDGNRITPETLTFEMWPDVSDYGADELFDAPGFTHPDGGQARLFSSDNAKTVLRHFKWMRDYGIDGAFLQHFLVECPGGPGEQHYRSRRRVMDHVMDAAEKTGRPWAISFDIAGMPHERIYDVLTAEWARLADAKVFDHPRYLHQDGRPVVHVFGFFWQEANNAMTPALANRIIDFSQSKPAFLIGGGSWHWRTVQDDEWQEFYRRFDAYTPWNVANYSIAEDGTKSATTAYWADDKRDFDDRGKLWIPVVYPGFSWDNLKRQKPGTSDVPRRRGAFLWEQVHAAASLKCDTVFVAMFDEVDEATAIFKVTSDPPTQAHFVGYEGLPSDWYLRLVGEGTQMLRGQRPLTEEIPIKPAR